MVHIFWYFDPKSHIQIQINTFGHASSEIVSKLTLDNSNY